ncbi:acetyl-coenzyme A synthetase N-terminal domain-containing protein [Burkholderia multivorans]|uniref:acetyl-coenzyme A synthetase N-terminal domain-containing protein n=1 Tax=Burkholderia multivorans TaxID=87883 RepID=UPI0030EBC025
MGASGKRDAELEKAFHTVLDESNAPFYTWFEDGQLNASYTASTVTSKPATASASRSLSKLTTAPSPTSLSGSAATRLALCECVEKRGVKKGDAW